MKDHSDFVGSYVHPLDPPAPRPTLQEALKSLEAGVKGFNKPRTDRTKALERRRYPERDNAMDRYWSIHSEQEMVDKRLANFPLEDTRKFKQLPLPFAA